MKILAVALSSIVLGAFVSQVAMAQTPYGTQYDRRVDSLQPGAGAPGGAGGGGGTMPADRAGASCGNPSTSDIERPRAGTPPLDPSRKVYAVDCTRPFDALGKGNLCCQ